MQISDHPSALLRLAARRGRRLPDLGSVLLWAYVSGVVAFLLAPLVILLLTSFTASRSVEFPPTGLSLQWYGTLFDTLLGKPGTRVGLSSSIVFSLQLAVLSAALSVTCGVLAALALHKFRFWGRQLLNNLFLLPLIFPQLVVGVALLLMFSELHLFSSMLLVRLAIGHVVTSLPFVILTVGASLAVYEESVEEAARSLGANAAQTFWYVTLPLIRPGLIGGLVFAFITSLTQFTISYFLSTGVHPLPVWLYDFISLGHDPLLATISVVLIAAAFAVVFIIERLVGVRRVFASG